AEGAAVATLFTQLLTAVAQVFYSFRRLRLNFPRMYPIRIGGFTVIAFLAVYLLQFIALPLMVDIILSMMIVLLFAVIMKLFNYQAAIELLKSRFR
ncbi:MAG: hypothetical protein ACPF9D_01920, partial [Owenweeksia sp.]